jgi:phosphatidylserine/phosphatidylglycerophosphate/cardiolipin synthase-like enzyme
LGIFTGQTPSATQRAVTPTAPATAGGSGGAWWTVYFTAGGNARNPDDVTGTVAERLIERINQAQKSIHIAAFEFNLTPIAQALLAAQARGVEVQWVTDDEYGLEADAEEGHGQFAMLQQASISLKDDGRTALMHNKFWIFDQQTVWTGSMNVTVNDVFRNNNNVIVVESPELAALYEREFAEMWTGQFGPTSPATVDQQTVTIDGTLVQVYFAAEDEAISHLLPLMSNAQQSIRFMAFSFTHVDLGAALLARAKAGVDIQGIFETRGSETEASELRSLFCTGLPVRQDGNPGTFHHKVFVIDEAIVITGSLNFSDNADNSNDENVIVLHNRDIAALYLQEFDRRWAEAVTPNVEKLGCS